MLNAGVRVIKVSVSLFPQRRISSSKKRKFDIIAVVFNL